MSKFRILCIDGGGIKGVFPASLLSHIEKITQKSIVKYFDLIVGTSTGGIIALGLGLGFSANAILDFYVNDSISIFPSTTFLEKTKSNFKHWFYRKYSEQPLETVLLELFKNKFLGDSQCRLVIPSFDVNRGDVWLYKTAHHTRLQNDYKERAYRVALATAAAPSYFPSMTTPSGTPLIDGGIWANNPCMVSIVEALTILNIPLADISLLSIGTTASPVSVSYWKRQNGGKLSWAKTMSDLLMHGQSVAANNQAELILGKDRFLRINPIVESGRFELDSSKKSIISDLAGLGESEARRRSNEINSRFLQNIVVPFKPEYSIEKTA